MTLLSLLLSYFPMLVLGLASATFIYFCISPSIWSGLGFCFVLYGLPPLVYRLHQAFYPVEEGISYLRGKAYSPWWGSHQIQVIYIALPALEAGLRLVPGLFSLWLRLWGAKVGRQVYWTPGVEISDRGFLDIGDRVIFGHRTSLYTHVIKPRKDNLMLYIKTIKIGHDVFIGAGSVLAPGVTIDDGVYLPIETRVHPNKQVKSCDGSFKVLDTSSPPLPSDFTSP